MPELGVTRGEGVAQREAREAGGFEGGKETPRLGF